jgi:hypothetical protein
MLDQTSLGVQVLQQNLEVHDTRPPHGPSHCFPFPAPLLAVLGSGPASISSSTCSITPFQIQRASVQRPSKNESAAMPVLIPLSCLNTSQTTTTLTTNNNIIPNHHHHHHHDTKQDFFFYDEGSGTSYAMQDERPRTSCGLGQTYSWAMGEITRGFIFIFLFPFPFSLLLL